MYAPIVTAPPRPHDWREFSIYPDIHRPPFCPHIPLDVKSVAHVGALKVTAATDGSHSGEQQQTADVLYM